MHCPLYIPIYYSMNKFVLKTGHMPKSPYAMCAVISKSNDRINKLKKNTNGSGRRYRTNECAMAWSKLAITFQLCFHQKLSETITNSIHRNVDHGIIGENVFAVTTKIKMIAIFSGANRLYLLRSTSEER